MKNLLIIVIMFWSVFAITAQETQKKSKKELKAEKKALQMQETKAIVESKNFVFNARNANPMSARSINLTTDYDVKITNDSIYSYLPYYGVSHSAVYGGTESPMIFSQPFETISSEEVKNGYLVKVAVKNGSDRLDFSFHISVTGSTTLSVSSMNRQAISYYGEVIKTEEKNN
jgi:outer membrane phospholipase A